MCKWSKVKIKCYYIVNNYTCFFCQKQCDRSQARLLKCSKSLLLRWCLSIKEQLIGNYLIKLPVGSEAKVSWSLSTMWANAARPFLKEPHTCLILTHTHTHTHTHLDTVILHTYSPKKSASAAAKSRIEEKPTGGEERPKKKKKKSDHRPGRRFCLRLLPVRGEDTTCYTLRVLNIAPCWLGLALRITCRATGNMSGEKKWVIWVDRYDLLH